MKGAVSKTAQWQDRLDIKWRALPVKSQRRYTVLLFLAYLCIAAGIGIKYYIEAGKQSPAIEIRYIDAKAPEVNSIIQHKQLIKRQNR